jgi:hypothetical protein
MNCTISLQSDGRAGAAGTFMEIQHYKGGQLTSGFVSDQPDINSPRHVNTELCGIPLIQI